MEPVAPEFLVKRLAAVYVDADGARNPAEAADRARLLLLASSRLLLLGDAHVQDAKDRKQGALADKTTEVVPSTSQRVARPLEVLLERP